MQKYFEKIKERLERERDIHQNAYDVSTWVPNKIGFASYVSACKEAIRIVNQVAEEVAVAEYATTNDGLIALPKEAFDRMIARMESESEIDIYEEESLFINVRDAGRIIKEIAAEYQQKGE